jgi:hypothetical protein
MQEFDRQFFLGAPAPVDRGLADACASRDVFEAEPRESVLDEQLAKRLENRAMGGVGYLMDGPSGPPKQAERTSTRAPIRGRLRPSATSPHRPAAEVPSGPRSMP